MCDCTIVCGRTLLIASGRAFNPSQTAIHTSATPRLRISVSTSGQYFAPVVVSSG